MKFRVAISLMLLSTSIAHAAPIDMQLQGQCRDHTFSYYEYEIDVQSAELAALPAASEVRLITNFLGVGSVNSLPNRGPFLDFAPDVSKMLRDPRSETPLLQSRRRMMYMATGGYVSHMDIRFEVDLPTGELLFFPALEENEEGQWIVPVYRTQIFEPHAQECWHMRHPVKLSFTIERPDY